MLNPEKVAQIKACRGVYSVGDTANYFGVSKETVHAVWTGKRHTSVLPASEPANINSSRISPDVIKEDGRLLLARGMSVEAAAKTLGISPNTLRNHLYKKEAAPCLLVF